MEAGTWWATIHGVAESQTRLSNFTHNNHRALGSLKGQTDTGGKEKAVIAVGEE